MEVVVWIAIILVAILLIRLLRKWIKRLIFILIIILVAFFIYGLFNPSGASRLWYNVRTFPARVTSWVSDKTFLDYDSYKLDLPKIDKIQMNDDDKDMSSSEVDDKDILGSKSKDKNDKVKVDDKKVNESEKTVKDSDKNVDNSEKVSQSFSSVTSFTANLADLTDLSSKDDVLTGYTQTDLMGIIGDYVNNNLDEDTDILVTMEYGTGDSPEKIILKTTDKENDTEIHSAALSLLGLLDVSLGSAKRKTEVLLGDKNEEPIIVEKKDVVLKVEEKVEEPVVEKKVTTMTPTSKTTTSTKGLSQKDVAEAEYIFGILF